MIMKKTLHRCKEDPKCLHIGHESALRSYLHQSSSYGGHSIIGYHFSCKMRITKKTVFDTENLTPPPIKKGKRIVGLKSDMGITQR